MAASSVEMAAKKRPKKKPVKKQVRYLGLPRPPPSSPIPRTQFHAISRCIHSTTTPPQAASDDGDLFVHEGTKGFTGDPNAFVYRVGLSE